MFFPQRLTSVFVLYSWCDGIDVFLLHLFGVSFVVFKFVHSCYIGMTFVLYWLGLSIASASYQSCVSIAFVFHCLYIRIR